MKINLLNQVYQQTNDEHFYQEAISWIDKLSKKEPYSRQLLEEEYSLHLINNDLESAANVVSRALNYFPWDISLYERTIMLYFDLGMQAHELEDVENRNVFWKNAIETYEIAMQRKKQNEENYELHKTKWRLKNTTEIALSLVQIHIIEGNYDKASALLEDKIPKEISTENDRKIVRWYLASLKLQGKEDRKIFEALLELDPREDQRIQEIIDTYNEYE